MINTERMIIMDKEKMKKTFPCYRNDDGKILFDQSMLPEEAIQQDFDVVFRLCLNGKVNHEAFLCTYLDPFNNRDKTKDLDKASTFSTSCKKKINEIRRLKACMQKNQPKAVVAKGKISADSGYSYYKKKKDHIDWWIFEEEKPEEYFYIYEE